MNTHVDFENAKLLKEKGFDEPCYSYFTWMTKEIVQGNAYEDNRNSKFEAIKESNVTVLVSAPTIAEVVMWLYEKHGIWIFVDFGLGWEGFTIPCGYTGNATTENLHWNDNKFNSPTEAYLQAINYCLTKLI